VLWLSLVCCCLLVPAARGLLPRVAVAPCARKGVTRMMFALPKDVRESLAVVSSDG
jgi:hypothetical protein